MKGLPFWNRRTGGHREESVDLYKAWAFSAESPRYKSWIIYSLFPFGACLNINALHSDHSHPDLHRPKGLLPKESMYGRSQLTYTHTKHFHGSSVSEDRKYRSAKKVFTQSRRCVCLYELYTHAGQKGLLLSQWNHRQTGNRDTWKKHQHSEVHSAAERMLNHLVS